MTAPIITAHCAQCSGPVVSDPDATLCRACWARENVTAPASAAREAGERPRVTVDAIALDDLEAVAYNRCSQRQGEPCGKTSCHDCVQCRAIDHLIATAAPLPAPTPAMGEAEAWALVDAVDEARLATYGGMPPGVTYADRVAAYDTARAALIARLTAAPSPAPGGVDRAAFIEAARKYAFAFERAVTAADHNAGGTGHTRALAREHAALAALLTLVPFAPPADAQAVGE